MRTGQGTPGGVRAWCRNRPFVGALLIVIAGVEMFLSTQLDIGNLHIQLGIEGFQATVIPVGFVLLGVLIAFMPQHRVFYGVLALALSLYSIIGVNLGGFIVGMLLSAIGGILAVSWVPAVPASAVAATTAGAAELTAHASSTALEDVGVLEGSVSGSGSGSHAEFAPYSKLVAIARSNAQSNAPVLDHAAV